MDLLTIDAMWSANTLKPVYTVMKRRNESVWTWFQMIWE